MVGPKSQPEVGVKSPQTSKRAECRNLETWTQNVTIPNINVADFSILSNPILAMDAIFEQTICHKQGRFRTTSVKKWNISDTQLLHEWEFKLIYLALHDLHHRPARKHYISTKDCPRSDSLNFNLPCPEAKFLLSRAPELGMGASIRNGAIAHVLSAIAIGRVPLFVGRIQEGPEFLQKPWFLTSCPRQDLQCIFLPTTPCALSDKDWKEAVLVNKTIARAIRRSGNITEDLDRHRVLIMDTIMHPIRGDHFPGIHSAVRQRVYQRSMELIEAPDQEVTSPLDYHMSEFLKAAARGILDRDEAPNADSLYSYAHRDYRIPHAVLLYLLRPNASTKAGLDARLLELLPNTPMSQSSFETTIGLPIRGSDKCDIESTCLEFDQYMQLANETWQNMNFNISSKSLRGTLILTTEDKKIFEQRSAYSSKSFPFVFVVNDQDSMQGTGSIRDFGRKADAVMKSSLVALQMQLHAGHVFGNVSVPPKKEASAVKCST